MAQAHGNEPIERSVKQSVSYIISDDNNSGVRAFQINGKILLIQAFSANVHGTEEKAQ